MASGIIEQISYKMNIYKLWRPGHAYLGVYYAETWSENQAREEFRRHVIKPSGTNPVTEEQARDHAENAICLKQEENLDRVTYSRETESFKKVEPVRKQDSLIGRYLRGEQF